MDKQTRFLMLAQTLLLGMVLVLVLTRPTSKATVTSPYDTIRYVIIREIYEVDKRHDSLVATFVDTMHKPTTTHSILSILRQYDKRDK